MVGKGCPCWASLNMSGGGEAAVQWGPRWTNLWRGVPCTGGCLCGEVQYIMGNGHMGCPLLVDGQTEKITFPQLYWRAVIIYMKPKPVVSFPPWRHRCRGKWSIVDILLVTRRVTLVVNFTFLPQNLWKVAGTYKWYFDILSVCERSFSS